MLPPLSTEGLPKKPSEKLLPTPALSHCSSPWTVQGWAGLTLSISWKPLREAWQTSSLRGQSLGTKPGNSLAKF